MGTFTSGKFGKQKSKPPTTPDCTTSSTGYVPPRLHLLEGQTTGSQTLKSKLQSVGDIKSWHSIAGVPTNGSPTGIFPAPGTFTLLTPALYLLETSDNAASAL